MLCYNIVCCVVLCCIVLRCVVLCCDVLCCFVVLSQADHVPQIYNYVYDYGASKILKRLNTNSLFTCSINIHPT